MLMMIILSKQDRKMSKTVCHKTEGFKETNKKAEATEINKKPNTFLWSNRRGIPEDILEILQTSPINASWE